MTPDEIIKLIDHARERGVKYLKADGLELSLDRTPPRRQDDALSDPLVDAINEELG